MKKAWNSFVNWFTRTVNVWSRIVDWATHHKPDRLKGPYITSVTHAVVAVLGLMAPLPKLGPQPLGLLGIAIFFFTGIPFVWLAASALTVGWYWRREYRQTGLKPKPRYRDGEKLSFGQRFDTWMDAIFPTVAVVLQWMWLL